MPNKILFLSLISSRFRIHIKSVFALVLLLLPSQQHNFILSSSTMTRSHHHTHQLSKSNIHQKRKPSQEFVVNSENTTTTTTGGAYFSPTHHHHHLQRGHPRRHPLFFRAFKINGSNGCFVEVGTRTFLDRHDDKTFTSKFSRMLAADGRRR